MTRHNLVIEGRPRPKERPRFTRSGKTYTPKATLDYERIIAEAYRASGGPTFEGPVSVVIGFSEGQQSVSICSLNTEKPKLRGDIDNYIKATLDGLQQGGAFKNDSQVVSVDAVKA